MENQHYDRYIYREMTKRADEVNAMETMTKNIARVCAMYPWVHVNVYLW